MTASSVASVKVQREQIEQLARVLRLELRLNESGSALWRRCLERASELAQGDRATGRARVLIVEAEGSNTAALEALGTFRNALGGAFEAEPTDEAGRAPAHPDGC